MSSMTFEQKVEHEADKLNWPESLVKATSDPFGYELKLSTGERIRFTEAKYLSKNWVRIFSFSDKGFDVEGIPKAPRGLDIQVSEVVWVCDAPEGS